MWIPDDLYRAHVQMNLVESNVHEAKNANEPPTLTNRKVRVPTYITKEIIVKRICEHISET